MGSMGKYLIYGLNGLELGGMMTKTKDMPLPPSWVFYGFNESASDSAST